MTVPTTTSRMPAYTGNGVTTAFPYTFRVFAATDLVVETQISGVQATKTYLSDYTVSGVLSYSGGNVTFLVAPANGTIVSISRSVALTQNSDLQNQGAYYAQTIEDAIDREIMGEQQLQDQLNRALKLPGTDTISVAATLLPTAVVRASKYLGFDVSGNPVALPNPLITTSLIDVGLVQVVDNIAALRALATPSGNTQFYVRGYYTAGDGAGGIVRWNSTDTTADNGGTVFMPNSAPGTGRWNRPTMGPINVREFGAHADGVTDDYAIIMAAEAWAFANGRTLWFPTTALPYAVVQASGVRLGFRVSAASDGATIKYTGSFVFSYNALSNYHPTTLAKTTGLTFSGLTIDCNNLAQGLYLESGNDCRVENCTFNNCLVGGVFASESARVIITKCRVNGVKYIPGGTGSADGLYLGGCTDCILRDNVVQNFRRIGIVSESNTSKSSNNRVLNNIIFNANNCDDSLTEYNAAIWFENSNGGVIEGNNCYQIGGNAGQTSGRIFGITAPALGDTLPSLTIIRGNRLSVHTGSATPLYLGIVASGSASSQSVLIEQNYVADCQTAVYIGNGLAFVTIRDNVYQNVRAPNASAGLYVFDCVTTQPQGVTISGDRFRGYVDADAAGDSAHINFYQGYVAGTLVLENLQGMAYVHRGSVRHTKLQIVNCDLSYGSTTGYGCIKAAEAYILNSKWSQYSGRGGSAFISTAGGTSRVIFSNCQFDTQYAVVQGANGLELYFNSCKFYNGWSWQMTITGTYLNFGFTDCYAEEYHATNGFVITSGTTAGTFRAFFRGNFFNRSTNVTPIKKGANQPVKSVFAYNSFGGAIVAVHDYAAPTQDIGSIAV